MKKNSQHYIFDELADFLATMEPEKVLGFHTSEKSQKRLDKLLAKNKTTEGLTEDEKTEVEHFMILERIVTRSKTRALKKLAQKQRA